MLSPILLTRVFVPSLRQPHVVRTRLVALLDEGLQRRLTLISAPAGFGKTTLVTAWVAHTQRPTAWLSLDQDDHDPIRFLAGIVAALQTLQPGWGEQLRAAIHAPQAPSTDAILHALSHELVSLVSLSRPVVLVLEDYHLVDSPPVDSALDFILEHMPPSMHRVVTTREDPPIALARLHVRGELTELRVTDLRFLRTEIAEFLNDVMGLALAADDITALEKRTEGWVAGLQLAALSLRGHADTSGFIQSFTGSHRFFVLDYPLEEVLERQSLPVQQFLLKTALLDRLCGPLCDALLLEPAGTGQAILEAIEHANLFVVALDNERKWYRYHHLFSELLRQRRSLLGTDMELHVRASAWYEAEGQDIVAFQHAVAANSEVLTSTNVSGETRQVFVPVE